MNTESFESRAGLSPEIAVGFFLEHIQLANARLKASLADMDPQSESYRRLRTFLTSLNALALTPLNSKERATMKEYVCSLLK